MFLEVLDAGCELFMRRDFFNCSLDVRVSVGILFLISMFLGLLNSGGLILFEVAFGFIPFCREVAWASAA